MRKGNHINGKEEAPERSGKNPEKTLQNLEKRGYMLVSCRTFHPDEYLAGPDGILLGKNSDGTFDSGSSYATAYHDFCFTGEGNERRYRPEDDVIFVKKIQDGRVFIVICVKSSQEDVEGVRETVAERATNVLDFPNAEERGR